MPPPSTTTGLHPHDSPVSSKTRKRKVSSTVLQHTPNWWAVIAVLRGTPALASLSRDDILEIANEMSSVYVEANTTIFRKGTTPEYFYVIVDGIVRLFEPDADQTQPKIIQELHPGQYFGDVSLLLNTKTFFGASAKTKCVLFRLSARQFREMLAPCLRDMTNAVPRLYPGLEHIYGAALEEDLDTATRKTKDDEAKEMRRRRRSSTHLSSRLPFLSQVSFLRSVSEDMLRIVAAEAQTMTFVDGDLIVVQDDTSQDIYILEEGDAVAFKRPPAGSSPVELRWIEPGDYFGELAYLGGGFRTANVVSYGSSRVLRLSKELCDRLPKTCRTYLRRQVKRYRSVGEKFVNSIPMFAHFKASEKVSVADAIQLETYKAGQLVIGEGDAPNKMYFLDSGEVVVTRGDPPTHVRTFRKKGDFFGEYAILMQIPRTMSVVAAKTTRLFSLHVDLIHVLKPCQNVLLERIKQYQDMDAEAVSVDKKRDQVEQVQQFLAQVPAFECLSHVERRKLANAVEVMRCGPDTHVVKQGHQGNAFFIIQSGNLVVYRDTDDGDRVELNRLRAGEFFGEIAILTEHPRIAHVVTLDECRLLRVRRSAFSRILKPCHPALVQHIRKLPKISEYLPEKRLLNITRSPSVLELAPASPSKVRFQDDEDDSNEDDAGAKVAAAHRILGRRASVCAEKYHADEEGWVHKSVPKSDSAREKIAHIVKKNVLMSHLDTRQLYDIADAMFSQEIAVGEEIISQGTEGDNFYIVDSGSFDVFVFRDGKQEHVATIKDGGSFGELALLYNCPRAATVTATAPSLVWALDRITFRRLIIESNMRQMNRFELFLEKVPILAPLNKYERLKVAEALQVVEYEPNQLIIRKGDQGDAFFIVEEGEGLVFLDGKDGGDVIELKKLVPGDYFGEIALIMQKERCAHVKSVGHSRVLQLTVDAFTRLLGPCEERLRENLKLYKSINETFVEVVHILAFLPKQQRVKVAQALESRKYKFGDVIIREGDVGDRFFIIKDGQAAAYRTIDGRAKKVKWYTRGDYFGEIALITSEPRKATVVAKGSVECLTLSRDHFNELLGDIREEMLRNMREYTALS